MNADANRDFRWKRREALGSRAFGWPERALGWLSQVGFSLGSVANIVGAALRGRPLARNVARNTDSWPSMTVLFWLATNANNVGVATESHPYKCST